MTAPHQSVPVFTAQRLCLLLLILAITPAVNGAELKEARVTQVVKDMKLLPNAAAARPAAVSDQVRDGTAVRTGVESRAELTFTDSTLARLGANTIFSFTEGTRNLDLKDGVMLLRVPKNAGGAKINTAHIGRQNPANVFTTHPNYTGFGGNGSRTGTFAGAGANNPQPLNQAPPIGPGG